MNPTVRFSMLLAAACAGRPYFNAAVRALVSGRLNLDVPISVGVGLALGTAVFETSHHAPRAYFTSALVLLALLLVGGTLEQALRRRARPATGDFATLRAGTVMKFVSNAELAEMPATSTQPGDLVLVRPGERIAVDGVVIEGRSEIDQSLVTGETLMVSAVKDSIVCAGALNVSGALQVRVSHAPLPYRAPYAAKGREAVRGDVTRMAGRGREVHLRCARLVDRAARLHLPLVQAAAFATLLAWVAFGASWHEAIVAAIAVVIITCSCAWRLAVLAVQAAASRALLRAGLQPISREGIECLAGVDTILFDKTGTLTLPEPQVINAADIPPERLALAGRLALASRHPLAAAVARAAGAKELLAAVEEAGQGVCGEFEGVALRLGRPSFCGAERSAETILDAYPEASAIAFAYGTERYVLAVRQRLRDDAIEVVARLKQEGFAIEIMSGDRAPAVACAARTLGITRWRAAMTPADKVARISALQSQGRRVLMVGDGLNDAPSLAVADASLSTATAVHLAQAAADAVIFADRLAPVASAIAIARRERRLIRENLVYAVACNAVAAPIAILLYASPLSAALAVAGGSILVTINALRAKPVSGP